MLLRFFESSCSVPVGHCERLVVFFGGGRVIDRWSHCQTTISLRHHYYFATVVCSEFKNSMYDIADGVRSSCCATEGQKGA